MKKFVFAALAVLFIVSSGFVSITKEAKEDIYECRYSITHTTFGPEGQVYKKTRHYFAITDNEVACSGVANMHFTNIMMGNRPF